MHKNVHFDYVSILSDANVEKVGNPKKKKKCEKWKSPKMKTKESVIKLSQIYRRIQLCLREINLIYKIYSFSWQFNEMAKIPKSDQSQHTSRKYKSEKMG
jgi:hypothetical protein